MCHSSVGWPEADRDDLLLKLGRIGWTAIKWKYQVFSCGRLNVSRKRIFWEKTKDHTLTGEAGRRSQRHDGHKEVSARRKQMLRKMGGTESEGLVGGIRQQAPEGLLRRPCCGVPAVRHCCGS